MSSNPLIGMATAGDGVCFDGDGDLAMTKSSRDKVRSQMIVADLGNVISSCHITIKTPSLL